MKNKDVTTFNGKPLIKETLKSKLLVVVHKVLKDAHMELTGKIEKVVNKSIKRIVKKTDKKVKKVSEVT